MPAYGPDVISANIHKLVDSRDSQDSAAEQAAWNEIARLYDSNVKTPQDQKHLTNSLVESGVLPRLLVSIASAIDGDDYDETISKEELKERIDSTDGSVNPATKIASQYALDNFDAIDGCDGEERDGELSEEELVRWQQTHQGEGDPRTVNPYETNPENLEDPSAGDDALPEDAERYKKVLEKPYASEQEKLRAVEELNKLGVREIELTEPDGTVRKYQIQVESAGSGRNFVHLWDASSGKIVLRGIGKDGTYTQQVDKNGNPVPFQGSRWSKRNPDSNVTKYEN